MSRPIYYSENRLIKTPEFFRDPRWLKSRLDSNKTRIVPVWRNHNLIRNGQAPTAMTLCGDSANKILEMAGEIALLGLDPENGGDTAYFAIDVSAHDLPNLEAVTTGGQFIDLRQVGVLMGNRDGSLLAHARGLMYWHRHHCFCHKCGTQTTSADAGRLRRCNNPDCLREHFPRTDPAVIMLVTREGKNGESCLLGRQPNFPEGIYSTLAGFVDQGETLEQAVAREVFEEAGVRVENIAYRASQPWPFPASLMLGFRARAVTFDIDIGGDELEDARWFSKAQLADCEATGIRLSRKDSIAYSLVSEWLDE